MTETLANMVLRESYRPQTTFTRLMARPMHDLRAALVAARRFVLDERMSAFLADLASVPFATALVRRPGVLDAMRHGARLPHARTWIELDGIAFRRRLAVVAESKTDAWGKAMAPPEEVCPKIGWLLEQHPKVETAVMMTEFVDMSPLGKAGMSVGAPTFSIVWNTVDLPLPWHADTRAGVFSHGIQGYECDYIGVTYEKEIPKSRRVNVVDGTKPTFYTDAMVVEMGGIARYAMALLSTLNDVPVLETEVRTQKGFVARGAYRKFLDHTTLRLNVPVKRNTKLLARRLVAMARRRAHGVRGHWRLYERGEFFCDSASHTWGPPDDRGHMQCMNGECGAWRTWIAEHQRGDALLGFVTHEYAVTHET